MPRPVITGVHHLGLTVSDVELSAPWYEEVGGRRANGGHGDYGEENQSVA